MGRGAGDGTAAAVRAETIIRLYLGTSTVGWQVAKDRGFFGLRDHHALANEIEREFGLPEDAIWNHAWFDYVRGARARDQHVYTTDDLENAHYYANTLNESTIDALKTAHRIINDELMQEQNDLPDDAPEEVWEDAKQRWKQSETAFIADWRAKHADIKPIILALDVPVEHIPVPEHVRDRFTPVEWWETVTSGGTRFAHEIPFPEQIPTHYVVAEINPQAQAA